MDDSGLACGLANGNDEAHDTACLIEDHADEIAGLVTANIMPIEVADSLRVIMEELMIQYLPKEAASRIKERSK